MPEVPLQFGPSQESGHSEIAGAAPAIINAVVDAKGAVRRRPGLSTPTGVFSASVDSRGLFGLHKSPTGLLLAVGGQGVGYPAQVYRVGNAAATALGSMLNFRARPTFAETEALVVIAGDSARPVRVDLTAPYALQTLGGGPPNGLGVLATASRLLLDDPTVNGRVWFSAPALGGATLGHEQWTAGITALGTSGFFSAEARTDPVVALAENTNEVFVFGKSSTQVFAPDPTFGFSPVATKEYGCLAAASIVKDTQSFAWLDQYRRFVYSDGRSYEVVSDAIKEQLDELTRVDDCFGYRIVQGPIDVLAWTFPTDGVTFALQKGAGWSQWQGYSTLTNNYADLSVRAATFDDTSNRTLVGTASGTVRQFDADVATDEGTVIPFSATTGFNSHGTDARKHCESLKLVLKRGHTGETESVAELEYRDDGYGPWSSARRIGLGTTGDTQIVVQLRSLGTYRRRQWRFRYHGTDDLVLAGAYETFNVLGY